MNVHAMDTQTARWGVVGTTHAGARFSTAQRKQSSRAVYAPVMTVEIPAVRPLTRLKNRVMRIVFASRYREDLRGLLGVVGTAATLAFPDRPHWVRVEQTVTDLTARASLVLPVGTRLVPLELPKSEFTAKRWMHRLVGAEAARREVDEIECRAPTHDLDWVRAADAFLATFRGVQSPSAMAREALFEELTREVQLRFVFMVRRLRKARNKLVESGFLSNRDLEELWARYRYCDEDAQDTAALEAQGLLPDRLRPPTSTTP